SYDSQFRQFTDSIAQLVHQSFCHNTGSCSTINNSGQSLITDINVTSSCCGSLGVFSYVASLSSSLYTFSNCRPTSRVLCRSLADGKSRGQISNIVNDI